MNRDRSASPLTCLVVAAAIAAAAACGMTPSGAQLEADNPIRPNDAPPYGMEDFFADARPPTPARVRLGRWLFFDRRLSVDNTVSCATCHRPEYGFSDVTHASAGVGGQRGRRKTPSILNLGSRTVLIPAEDRGPMFFWDGRATSLEMQVLMPIRDPREMGLDHPGMVSRLSGISSYARYFSEAFGSAIITDNAVAAALADYVRTRRSGNSPYDRWAYGEEPGAISTQAQRGADLFSFKARCALCHAGFNFSDGAFHNLGIGWDASQRRFADVGRSAVTHAAGDTGKSKRLGCGTSRSAPRTCMTDRCARSAMSWSSTIVAAWTTPGSHRDCVVPSS